MKIKTLSYSIIRFYHLFRKHILHRDVQMFISPITVKHIERYRLAGKFIAPGSRVLDAACGSGYGSVFLKDCDYVGIDLDGSVLQYASQNYTGTFEQLPIQKVASLGEFDAIISFETLEHLDDPKAGMLALISSLKRGGSLILSFPLNHPDDIYHKTIFTPQKVDQLFVECFGSRTFKRTDFFQSAILIEELKQELTETGEGTLTVHLQEIMD
ncbi:MAG: class I SAM-dependent methyltransferase [Candidatus Marinimicrobia bacterium]|jgi:2-polyprenyl-3-methyl-5-hydroxy-6-metoxy-1,4-benzoquinol methylase|nr:class I SAM-dependent methyltransferase [Candidatus Neomarinimicrobiota bacterium]MBT3631346.1 class I SAM-dependent methyltransferase [Candidatus Neomarinimicrobiota bacterium]MBT3825186.1 class I SAM-dependent methyltransferase [Candidatus Neomarinimicrobiota bacterium]MBT4129364.1 class I SAM-dependent methyltransferase [Candidatus Neomarinimicrobiota bacterium]MBT4294261.1 class I SAM-dependent methyltransferase [Candidatus Neomarinimicrobiota bacterium]